MESKKKKTGSEEPRGRTGIKKMWHIYTMEYYSAVKRNETELFVVRWMDPETVIQSEVSQKGKQIPYANTYIWNLKNK